MGIQLTAASNAAPQMRCYWMVSFRSTREELNLSKSRPPCLP